MLKVASGQWHDEKFKKHTIKSSLISIFYLQQKLNFTYGKQIKDFKINTYKKISM